MARMDTLLLIDAGLADLDILLSGLNQGVVPFVVQPDQDVLEVLEAALETASSFDTLALVAHGRPGEVLIGREPITTASLSSRRAAWTSLASHRIGSLHLYACHAGLDQDFVDGLSAITGCAVAAADTTIGHAGLGAVWQLDVSSSPRFGSFQAKAANGLVPFSRAAQAGWVHQLATYYVGTSASGNGAGTSVNPWNQAGFDAATIAGTDTISINAGFTLTSVASKLDSVTVTGTGNLNITGWTGADLSGVGTGLGSFNVTASNGFSGGLWRIASANTLTIPAGASGNLSQTLTHLSANGFVVNGTVGTLSAADAATMAAFINGTGTLSLRNYTTEDLSGLTNISTVYVTTDPGAVLDTSK